jgi:hypothetical protein
MGMPRQVISAKEERLKLVDYKASNKYQRLNRNGEPSLPLRESI